MTLTPFVDDALHAFAEAFISLRTALGNAASFRLLLKEFGWEVDPALDNSGFDMVQQIFAAEIALLDTLEEADELARAAAISALVVSLLHRRIPDPSWPTPLNADLFWSGAADEPSFPRELLDSLLWDALADHAGAAFGLLRFAGIFREDARPDIPGVGGLPSRSAYVRRVLDWDQLTAIIADPAGAFKAVYHWNAVGGPFQATELLNAIGALFEGLPVIAAVIESSDTIYNYYYDRSATTSPDVLYQLTVAPFFLRGAAGSTFGRGRISLNAVPIPPAGVRSGDPVGFSLFPLITGQVGKQMEFAEGVTLTLNGDYTLVPLFAEIRPEGVTIDLPLGTLATLAAEARVDAQAITAPWILLGSTDGTRLELLQAHLALTVQGPPTDVAFGIEAGIDRAALVIAFSEGDSFLQSIFSSETQKADLSLIVGWSNREGFHIGGQGTLAMTFPVHQTLLGAITIDTVTIALAANANGRVVLTVAISAGFTLGPLVVTVDTMGLEGRFKRLNDGSGNLGPVDLDLGFKPPNGVGLEIDTSAIFGGGYLSFDVTKQEYSGILQLEIQEALTLTAIGLLTTRLPGGSKGFSLLIIITAQDFTPIQLGYGFTLNGVGGLLGVNRTVALEVLRAGLKNHTLDSIFFPENPIQNAPQIISALRGVFPPVENRYVLGPVAIIGWGNPPISEPDAKGPLVTLELGIILELPAPARLIILGQIKATLPHKTAPVVDLKMDALGVIDFARNSAAVDATLYDSRIETYPLSGDMALRMKWGTDPTFVLAVGGLNPRFQPPPDFPTLKRMSVSLVKGDNPRLRLEAYLALTSNTAQIGARIDLYDKEGGFSIEGFVEFDALFHFKPFQFVADVNGRVTVRKGGSKITTVNLDMTLTGPRPWHARGKAKFDFLGVRYAVHFNVSFGPAATPESPEAVDVTPLLVNAARDPRNWSGQFAQGDRPLVTVRPVSDDTQTVHVHPSSELTFRQRIVPLNLNVTHYGNAALIGEQRFTIHNVGVNGKLAAPSAAMEHFAPAQYFEMSDDEKLARPSFEQMEAGIRFGNDMLRQGASVQAPIRYATIIIDLQDAQIREETDTYEMPAENVPPLARVGAAGLAALRRTGRAKYRTCGPRVTVVDAAHMVATTDQLKGEDIPGLPPGQSLTYTQAIEALRSFVMAYPERHGSLQVTRARSA